MYGHKNGELDDKTVKFCFHLTNENSNYTYIKRGSYICHNLPKNNNPRNTWQKMILFHMLALR